MDSKTKHWIFQQYLKDLTNGKLSFSSGSLDDKQTQGDIYKKIS